MISLSIHLQPSQKRSLVAEQPGRASSVGVLEVPARVDAGGIRAVWFRNGAHLLEINLFFSCAG
jgi:hypothetical protein